MDTYQSELKKKKVRRWKREQRKPGWEKKTLSLLDHNRCGERPGGGLWVKRQRAGKETLQGRKVLRKAKRVKLS